MLSLYAKQELQSLLTETNHSLSIEDFDDITRLNELCLAITDNKSPDNDIIDMPVCIGGYQLKQPTIGVLEWYNGFYLPLCTNDPLLADAGLAYALTLSDNPNQLWELENVSVCKKTVRKFLRRLNCTHSELQETIKTLLVIDDQAEPDEPSDSCAGRLIAMLCKEYGHSVQYWLWEAPIGIINTFVDDYTDRAEAEVEAARNACKTNKPPPAESRIKKFKALRDSKAQMRDKWQKM